MMLGGEVKQNNSTFPMPVHEMPLHGGGLLCRRLYCDGVVTGPTCPETVNYSHICNTF